MAQQDKWRLIPEFLKTRGLVKQHIESFNYFINVDIKNIVNAKTNKYVRSEQIPKFYLMYKDINIGEPSYIEDFVTHPLTPQVCRIRDLTYSAPILVDLEFEVGNGVEERKDVLIGFMPVMLGCSKCILNGKNHQQLAALQECPYDPQGYFIIKGVEKVVLIQEQISNNRIIIELDAKKNLCAQVTSSTHDTKSRTTIYYKKEKLYLKHNSFDTDIPIFAVFKAMGLESDIEIVSLIGITSEIFEEISASLQEISQLNILTQYDALRYISKCLKQSKTPNKRKEPSLEYTKDVVQHMILSHIICEGNSTLPKCRYMALMVKRIIEAKKEPSLVDDKDYYGNKRLELAGQLISLLFEDVFKRFNSDIKKEVEHQLPSALKKGEPYDVIKCMRPFTIINGLESAISSGNWNLKRFKMERAGITQVLSRLSYSSVLGMMTKINSHFEKTRKISGPRALQPSQWGMVCPSDTPEGESCGLVKTLSLTSHITTDQDEKPILNLCYNLGMESLDFISGNEAHSNCIIFVNGQPVGLHMNRSYFIKSFRKFRRKGIISAYISIYYHSIQNCIIIATDGGRLIRPLIIVENGVPLITQDHINQLIDGKLSFDNCISKGLIEFLDVNEENDALIAITPKDVTIKSTHMEIDPLSILSCITGIIPYPHHNQSPRNVYQCAMGKQAIGVNSYNQMSRVDTLLLMQVYPQEPLVATKTIKMIHYDKLPAGQNATVAILSYSGYDIEDAVILNKASLDRGFGRIMTMRRESILLKRFSNGLTERVVPPPTSRFLQKKSAIIPPSLRKYKALDLDGLARIGSTVEPGDIIINKETPSAAQKARGFIEEIDSSKIDYDPERVTYKQSDPSYIDRVIITSNSEAPFVIKVLLRQTRRPELGDKYSSRHGQKGVIGLIVPQEDMPFTETGICPDLIMNPHGFPSRMTVGKMLELIAGKAGVLEGKIKDATAFAGDKAEDLAEILVKHGFSYSGKDLLMSGITGEPMGCYVFSGPVYYQRLKHMVTDKMHARSTGPKASLTRQPTEGRAKEGGLRLGEMERDCLIGFGASSLLNERLMLVSDLFTANVCRKCGFIIQEGYCNYCKDSDNVTKVMMPYASKLLFQELISMNIRPQLKLTAA